MERRIWRGKHKNINIDFDYFSFMLPIKIQCLNSIEFRREIYNSIDKMGNGYLSLNDLVHGMKDHLKLEAVFDCK